MQVYRGMDIGTAKPTVEERQGVPHHLIDVVEPADDSFSVDRWLKLAHEAISDIQARGRTSIIVGGTNLYVKAFLSGMLAGPAPDLTLREELRALDLVELRRRLELADPAGAQRIHANDRKRTIRAIEVFEQTGKPLSAMQTQWESSDQRSVVSGQLGNHKPIIIIGLDYPVEVINRRINARVKTMIEAGFVDEVRELWRAGKLGRNAREALGYKQIIEHLEGRGTLEEAVEHIKIRTRRFAKQQRTWLRRFRHHPGSIWLEPAEHSTPELAALIFQKIDRGCSAT